MDDHNDADEPVEDGGTPITEDSATEEEAATSAAVLVTDPEDIEPVRPAATVKAIPRTAAALSGVLAAGIALGVGELLSGLTGRIPSLVARVGDIVIENVPGSVERWAIDTFGENDKPALVIGITVIALLIGAATGISASIRFRSAWTVFGLFGLIGALAASSDPQRPAFWGWFAAFLAAAAGIGSLALLFRAARSTLLDLGDSSETERRSPLARRTFVSAATAAAAVGVATPVLGGALRGRQQAATEADREQVAAQLQQRAETTPTAVPTEIPEEAGAEDSEPAELVSTAPPASIDDNFDDLVEGITPIVVPNEDFYRIDTALVVPQIDVETWSMKVTGMVDNEIELTFDDLLAMDTVEEYVTLSCVSNQVGGDLVGNARWLGVPIKRLLDMAGVQPGATQIVGRSVDGWTGGFPTAYLDDPNRVALVAVAQNGEPLPIEHGFPARLVVAGLYGYVSATKWLKEIELTTLEGFDGYWIPRGWSKLGPIKTQSRIDVPRQNSQITAGPQVIAGVAWAPDRGIDKVEVQIASLNGEEPEFGPWMEAELSADVTDNSWRQWHLSWDAPAGDHGILVRATDGTGETQTEVRTPVAPDGASGWHTILVRAT
ncbi:MAG: molybdopterin-dependent oxidoreductase [Actinomycetota bacterium]